MPTLGMLVTERKFALQTVRDIIARVILGIKDYNAPLRRPHGFHLRKSAT